MLQNMAKRLKRRLPSVSPWTLERVVSHYRGAKRKRYELAAERYLAEGVTKRSANVGLFVKCEPTYMKEEFKAPRAIQPRSYEYNVALAKYIKPIEEVIYKLTGFGQKGVPRSRVIAKGMNMRKRARVIQEKWNNFDRPCVVTYDASRFDMHVSVEQLRAEHSVYLHMCDDPEFRRLLNYQLDNYGKCEHFTYRVKGKRMSGDMNTAVGNCVLMVMFMVACMEDASIDKYDILDDGDDVLVFIEASDVAKLASFSDTMLGFGHEVKVENTAYVLEDIEWCQSHPVLVGDGYKLVRDPVKILTRGVSGIKYYRNDEKTKRKLVNTIGLGELHLNSGVPVLQAYCEMLIRSAGTDDTLRLDSNDEYYHRFQVEGNPQLSGRSQEVTPESRESFARAYGIGIDEQIQLEDWFTTKHTFQVAGMNEVVEELDISRRYHFDNRTSVYAQWE